MPLVALLAFQIALGGLLKGGGVIQAGSGHLAIPIISGLTLTPSASTVVAQFTTQSSGDTQLNCGTASGGPYTIPAVDNGTQTGTTTHIGILAGLNASTPYFCQVASTNVAGTGSSTASTSTTAAAVTTPITGVSYGSIASINSLGGTCQMRGDTFYNTLLSNGTTLFTVDDTPAGFPGCGHPTGASNMQVAAFSGPFPSQGFTVNQLTGLGVNSQCLAPDNLSAKNSGIFAMAGKVFIAMGRQLNGGCPGYVNGNPLFQYHGEIMWSPDNGATWNNWQSPTTFTTTGVPTTAGMFGTTPSYWASAAFVMYCGDDGTYGYTQTCLQQDNANAYVYLIANEHCWNDCSNYYVARVPRVKLEHLSVGDYQYFTGGDGNLDSNWSNTATAATAILAGSLLMSEPSVQYVPALNRYIMLGYNYPNFSTEPAAGFSANTNWPVWEAPHPWGPWTMVSNQNFPTLGWYNPTVLVSSILTGTTPYILFAGDFAGAAPNYNVNYAVMTITH